MSHTKRSKNAKDAYVLIAEVGMSSSMILSNQKTFAEQTKECLILFLQQKIFTSNEVDVAVILSGANDTQNRLDYKHIHVVRDMKQVGWDAVQLVNDAVRAYNFDGDWMDALGVALDLIHHQVEIGITYTTVHIIFFSTFLSPFKASEITVKAYVDALTNLKTSLFFVGSFINEKLFENESNLKKGELLAYQIIQEAEGAFYSFEDFTANVLALTDRPHLGGTWNATLDIGSTIRIPVSGYIKVRKSDTLKWFEETTSGECLVDKEKTYQKEPSNALVDKEDIIYAYKYGSAYIPISHEDDEAYNYKSKSKCLSVLAFVDPIPAHFLDGNGTMFFFPQRKPKVVDRTAQVALSALIYAMEEMGRVAIVRRVYRENSRVTLGVLSPRIKLKYECLVFHELPFADDWRQYEFSPITTSKNKPSSEQLEAIDHLIDKLDLSAAEKRDEFAFDSTKISDPYEEYIRYVVAFKVLHPDDPSPDVPAHIKMNLLPSPSMMENAKEVLNRINELFPLEAKERVKSSQEASKREILPATADEELGNEKKKKRLDETGEVDLKSILVADVTKIGTANPVKDFSILLESAKKPVEEIYEELGKVILELLFDSGGTNVALMAKAQNCLQAYREHAVANGRVTVFNDWIVNFKKKVVSNYFSNFWQHNVSEPQLGLITEDESPLSSVDKQQAKQFFILPSRSDSLDAYDDDEELAFSKPTLIDHLFEKINWTSQVKLSLLVNSTRPVFMNT